MDFTKKQISEISGLSPRLVQFYTEEGLILPEKNTGEGRGNVRRFSRESLFDFLIVAELSKFGVTKVRISNFLKFLKNEHEAQNYIEFRFFEKGHWLLGYIYTTLNSNKVTTTFKTIYGGKDKTSILSYDEMKNFSSMVIIDLGKLAKKANKS